MHPPHPPTVDAPVCRRRPVRCVSTCESATKGRILPGITILGKFLMPVGVIVPNHFYFSAILCWCHCLLIKGKFFFYKETAPSRNIVLGAMCKVYYNDLQKLASTYSISNLNDGNNDIKMAIWCHFTSSFTL